MAHAGVKVMGGVSAAAPRRRRSLVGPEVVAHPRVLLLLDSLVPGGAERSTVAMLPYLVEAGIRPEVAYLHDRAGLQGEVEALGLPLHDLSGDGGRRGWVRRTTALLERRRPDLVHTSLYEADVCGRVAAMRQRVPVVSTLTTERYGADHLGDERLNPTKLRAAQLVDATTARATRRLHAVSEHVADTMADHLRYPRSRIEVVPRGRPATLAVEPDSLLRSRLRACLGLGRRPTVLAVARQDRVKGLDRLVAALAEVRTVVPGIVLLVAGRKGDDSAALGRQVGGLGLEDAVRFLGHRSDVGVLLAASDVFVLPSRREGLPGSVLEAMAAGTPIVANDLPQVREVVGPQEARLVRCDDISALAGAVVGLLSNREAARARASRAQQRFLDHFTLDRVGEGMAEFYRRSLVV